MGSHIYLDQQLRESDHHLHHQQDPLDLLDELDQPDPQDHQDHQDPKVHQDQVDHQELQLHHHHHVHQSVHKSVFQRVHSTVVQHARNSFNVLGFSQGQIIMRLHLAFDTMVWIKLLHFFIKEGNIFLYQIL